MTTHEPKQLPRRGRRGGWMRDPQRSVAKLDGSNSAQRAWLADRRASVDSEFVSKLKGAGAGVMDVFDEHLAAVDAVQVAMPSADEFRLPHLRRLARTEKVNPVHAAAVASPPVHVPAAPQDLPDVEASKKQRGEAPRALHRAPGAAAEASAGAGGQGHSEGRLGLGYRG